jgi:hypothetical protein
LLSELPSLITPDKYKRTRYVNERGVTFKQIAKTSNGDLYAEQTPHKESHTEIQFKNIRPLAELRKNYPELFDNLKKEDFNFKITPNTIRNRQGVRRPINQKQANRGISARNVFEECGAELSKGIQMHLAHRHGWSMGGAQSHTNLDPATAGSNYSTLAWIEAPLKQYILDSKIKQVAIKGTVFFHPLLPKIPIEVSYTASWGTGRVVKTSIFPLEQRKPTSYEHNLFKKLFVSLRTPEKNNGQPKLNSSMDEETVYSPNHFKFSG